MSLVATRWRFHRRLGTCILFKKKQKQKNNSIPVIWNSFLYNLIKFSFHKTLFNI